MDHRTFFEEERAKRIIEFGSDSEFKTLTNKWVLESMKRKYVYNFDWLGRPIIQFPQDILAIQELIWKVKPDLIIETGIAHGGSLILSASILALLDLEEAIASQEIVDIRKSKRQVIGIDIDIRSHNRRAIENHFLSSWIHMIEGSSVDNETISEVSQIASTHNKVMVFLDSNHTYEHVLNELEEYSKFVSVQSYIVVFDTFVEEVPKETFENRPWGPGNSPMRASKEFLGKNQHFLIDTEIQNKLMITVAPNGYLRRIS